MSTIPKGVFAKVTSTGDYAHSFKVGDLVTSLGEDFGHHHQGVWSRFKNEEGETQYLLPEHYALVEALKPVLVFGEGIVDEATSEQLPTKVVYGVLNAEDEIYATTADRDFARELKAALGGKRKGVRIFQYAAVKEIR